MRTLLDYEHEKSVELEEDDQAVLAGEEDVHVADDTETKDEAQAEAEEGDVLKEIRPLGFIKYIVLYL